MRWTQHLTATLAVGVGLSASAQAPNPPAAPKADAAARMDALLEEWARRGADTRTLDAEFKQAEYLKDWKITNHYTGRALLQAPNYACLDTLKVVDQGGKAAAVPHERIVCSGDKVWQYQSQVKQINIFPLDLRDPKAALDQGPLPFLFNMKVDEAKKRYKMSLLGENEKLYLIRVVPLLDVDRAEFIQADIWLNKTKFLPDALKLLNPNGKDTQTYTFTKIERNVPVEPKNFEGKVLKGWSVVDAAAPPQAAPRPAAPAAQPARRPMVGRRLPNH